MKFFTYNNINNNDNNIKELNINEKNNKNISVIVGTTLFEKNLNHILKLKFLILFQHINLII